MDVGMMAYLKQQFEFPEYQLVDLSYTYEDGMPVWPTHPHYHREVVEKYEVDAYFNKISFCEHNGTHLDAPIHFIQGGEPLDKIDCRSFFGRALIINAYRDYQEDHYLTLEQIKDWESKHCSIQQGDMVFVRFGMDNKYALEPHGKAFIEKWGGVSNEAAQYLTDKCIRIIGTDALCINAYDNPDDVHYIFLGKGVLIVENLRHLGNLPAVVGVAALPLKFKDGSGSPIRVIAFVPKET